MPPFCFRYPGLLLLPLAGLASGCGQPSPPSTPAETPVAETASAEPPTNARQSTADASAEQTDGLAANPAAKSAANLVDDDGRTLWASPTSGEPIDLSLVPDSSGLVLHLRPAALLASEEGRRVWRALGPALEAAPPEIERAETLVVGVTAGESYGAVDAATAIDPQPSDRLPLLSREIEQLLETSDADRHATIIFSPRFLLGDGGSLLQGPWAPLRELLLAEARDEWAAAALSLHLNAEDRLYWELRVLGNAAQPETQTAASLAQQARGWGDDLETVVDSGTWSPYSQAVVQRSPRMLAVVGAYARRGVEGRQAVVNGYTPAGSPHQLALAAERLVAELAAPVATTLAAAPEPEAASIAERLRTPVTIRFARESLETAVTILSDTLRTPITIRGRDLQLEGITRNQMLALDVQDSPAADALVEVLRQANPDPLAQNAADPRQRLVYVVGETTITITTRAAAERLGEPLPPAFQQE